MDFFASFDRRRVITVIAVLGVAIGAGHLMQSYLIDNASEPTATVGGAPDAAPIIETEDGLRPLPVPPAATLAPLTPPPRLPERVEEADPLDLDEVRFSPFGVPCTARLHAELQPAAWLTVRIEAPCAPGDVAIIRQKALAVTLSLDRYGMAETVLPALGAPTFLTAEIGDAVLQARIASPDLLRFDHAVLVAPHDASLNLVARERLGRREVMITSDEPKGAMRAITGEGGFMTEVWTDDERLEVYTSPIERNGNTSVARLGVDAHITDDACGKVVEAFAVQESGFDAPDTAKVRLKIPDCDRVGETVRLKNLFRDKRLARR